MTALPCLTDFRCAHPGCGAIRGFRCTYSGWSKGHPIRQQRVIQAIDRRVDCARSAKLRNELIEHRAAQLIAFGWPLPYVDDEPRDFDDISAEAIASAPDRASLVAVVRALDLALDGAAA